MDKSLEGTPTIIAEEFPKHIKLKKTIHLFGGVVVTMLLLSTIFFSFKYFQLRTEVNTLKPKTNENESDSSYGGISEEAKKEIDKILSGQIEFNDKMGDVSHYLDVFHLSENGEPLSLSLEVFKYYPGAKYQPLKYDLPNTVNLDDEIADFNKLKLGQNVLDISTDNPIIKSVIKLKKIGNNTWSISERLNSSPGGSSESESVIYLSYLPDTKYLAKITLTGRNFIKENFECYKTDIKGNSDECYKTYYYPQKSADIISELEFILLQIKK